MIIDAYTHLFPEQYLKTISAMLDPGQMATWFRNTPLCNIDARLRTIEAIPEYKQVIANSMPPIEALGTPADTPELARLSNDGLAQYCADYPDHFAAFVASLPMNNVDAAVAEIDRAINTLGARGVQIFSNVNGIPLDDPQFLPVFERMAEHDLPIWLHPVRSGEFADYRTETLSKFAGFFTFGWPYETSIAMTHLIFSGLFDRFPGIKIIAHHLGAMVPAFEGRIGVGFDDFTRYTSDGELKAALERLAYHPADYYRMFYADTATFGSAAGTRMGVAYFGADRCVFASDAPFGRPGGIATAVDTIEIVQSLGLNAGELDGILYGTVSRLLRL
ncbi:amidohydrolase family protein [Sinorhizobium medicae]|uniref:amidohydrolase family protein n=1 Tax=Sinorhizobium medicae TaxID=110321 RepID=UPI000FDB7E0A|nr:amidohydrolase family protein [Sinorhizobium medicae]RVH84103.1 amidohydrolase [Sinorhizobium medicae]